jgi:hypothetical protein
MSGLVEKWQNWGLVSAYILMLRDPGTCKNCRQVMMQQIAMWGITEQLLERMFHVEDVENLNLE